MKNAWNIKCYKYSDDQKSSNSTKISSNKFN